MTHTIHVQIKTRLVPPKPLKTIDLQINSKKSRSTIIVIEENSTFEQTFPVKPVIAGRWQEQLVGHY